MSNSRGPLGSRISVGDQDVPSFLYGTAWKEDDTCRLVRTALAAGFRGIDTANQRKHYHEAAVGEAIATAIEEGLVSRDELFLQTKFTYAAGQDHRLPYDLEAAPGEQVRQSFERSLEHLQVDRIDSLVLHGPMLRSGLHPTDLEAWSAMEELLDQKRVRFLGVSNISLPQLEELCGRARRGPSFVQNRCFAVNAWDHRLRAFCLEHRIVYQGFSLLTANPEVLSDPLLQDMAQRTQRSATQLIFRFALQVGMQALTGTTDAAHMKADLEAQDFVLQAEDVQLIERLGLRS